MKSFKDVYKEKDIKRLKRKVKRKPHASLKLTGMTSPSYTGDSNYVNQPPIGNPPNVGYTQSFGT